MSPAISLKATENTQLRNLLLFATASLTWIGADLALPLLDKSADFRLFTTYLLPAIGGIAVLLVDRLSRQGVSGVPLPAAIVGTVFIAGGAAFDLTTTMFINPNLSREANPFIRAMIDAGHSLTYVYCHFGITQLVFVVAFCITWLAFLRHRPILLETIIAAKPTSRFEFLKAATGGAHLTTRQWLFPVNRAELPMLYHSIWVAACAVIFGISLFRWYVALEWLDMVPADTVLRVVVVGGGVIGSLVVYFISLWRLYQDAIRQTHAARRA